MNTKQREKWIDWGIFAGMLLLASAVTFVLFYRQTLAEGGGLYHSDMKAYILEMQGLDSGYSFPYPLFFKLGAFFHLFAGPELSVALAAVLLNSLGMVFTKLVLNQLTAESLEGRAVQNGAAQPSAIQGGGVQHGPALSSAGMPVLLRGALISGAAVSLFFVSMLFPPRGIYLPGIKYNYLGVFTANPFHNATYMAARPFAILAFFWYVRLLDVYEKGQTGKIREYVFFSLSLLLATMTKPSFTLVLVGAAGLIMVWRMIKSRFRNFRQTLQLGLCFLPTFVDLLYQYRGVFVPSEGEEGGVGFCLGNIWRLYCDNIPLGVCLAAGFPLLVLLLNWKELKRDTFFRFSWQTFLMSFAMAFFLYEKGFREPDFNFSWGYMYGIFFVFLGALEVLLIRTFKKKQGRRERILLAVQWLAYLWHLSCGLYYFYGIFRGAMYY